MLEESKNVKSQIKDFEQKSVTPYGTNTSNMSVIFLPYTKTNKLISALYMVTDIMDKEEPVKNKLRNLGVNILSDIHSSHKGQDLYNKINSKTSEILSLLEIASSVRIISTMNSNILIKEFIEFKKAIKEITSKNDHDNWLEEFLITSTDQKTEERSREGKEFSIGHSITKIGIQRGGTLMKALSDKIPGLDKRNKLNNRSRIENVDVLKNKRREEIVLIIKDKIKNFPDLNGVTITDIKSNSLPAGVGQGVIASCSEKTLQRELVSMVLAGILVKTGEKRWSRYSLN